MRVRVDDQPGIVASNLHQLDLMLGMGDAEAGRPDWRVPESPPPRSRRSSSDSEAVLGLAHDAETVAGGTERRLVEEEAHRRPVAADASAELVGLREADARRARSP